MSEKTKILFLQFLMIATGIVAVMSIEGIIYHLLGDDFYLMWYHPVSILLAAAGCTIPSVFLTGFGEWPKSKFITRLLIHAIVLYIFIVGMGYIFHWYSVLSGFLTVSIGYALVYIFVWVATLWISKCDANVINKALDEIRDEE